MNPKGLVIENQLVSKTCMFLEFHPSEGLKHTNRSLFWIFDYWLKLQRIPLWNLNMSIANDIYLEVRKHKESSDKYKAEDYTVLEAIESIIHSRKGGQTQLPSPVEYFSCIMSTLSQSNDHYRSVRFIFISLLNSYFFFSNSFSP